MMEYMGGLQRYTPELDQFLRAERELLPTAGTGYLGPYQPQLGF